MALTAPESANVTLVKVYLRAQNLEQLGRLDEAVELYEQALRGHFDSTGPYDRLIAIYADRGRHGEVLRVAGEAIAHVHTHGEKRAWYRRMREEAGKAMAKAPKATPKPARLPGGHNAPDGGAEPPA